MKLVCPEPGVYLLANTGVYQHPFFSSACFEENSSIAYCRGNELVFAVLVLD